MRRAWRWTLRPENESSRRNPHAEVAKPGAGFKSEAAAPRAAAVSSPLFPRLQQRSSPVQREHRGEHAGRIDHREWGIGTDAQRDESRAIDVLCFWIHLRRSRTNNCSASWQPQLGSKALMRTMTPSQPPLTSKRTNSLPLGGGRNLTVIDGAEPPGSVILCTPPPRDWVAPPAVLRASGVQWIRSSEVCTS